jgi:hypothetical protein
MEMIDLPISLFRYYKSDKISSPISLVHYGVYLIQILNMSDLFSV